MLVTGQMLCEEPELRHPGALPGPNLYTLRGLYQTLPAISEPSLGDRLIDAPQAWFGRTSFRASVKKTLTNSILPPAQVIIPRTPPLPPMHLHAAVLAPYPLAVP